MVNIAIIEDEPMLREELTDFFKKNNRIYCVLVVDSVVKFQHFYRPFMEIDIVLLDINLPGMSGLDGISIIRNMLPDVEIVMHTIVNDHDTIFKCICAGANGYLLKNGDLAELESTLLSIKENNGCALTPAVARRIISYFQPKRHQESAESLSEQELKVIRFLVDGLSYQEVADALNISINGVRYQVKNIYKKLHIKSRSALLKRYWEGRINLS